MSPESALPPHLRNRCHEDYIWPLSLIPRGWTAFAWKQPPKLLIGKKVIDWTHYPTGNKYYGENPKQEGWGPNPVQRHKGSWMITWPLCLTITFKNRWFFRIGARWDDLDKYFQVPSIMLNRLPEKDFETS